MSLVLETERLCVRELEPGDPPFVSQMLGDPNTMRFWPRPYTTIESADWIERHRKRYESDGHGYWLLSLRSGEPLGQVGVLTQDVRLPAGLKPSGPVIGLGYILHHPFWGCGYATEAAGACLDWAFANKGVPFVVALIRPENVPSIAVARRLGMEINGEVEYAGFAHSVFVKKA